MDVPDITFDELVLLMIMIQSSKSAHTKNGLPDPDHAVTTIEQFLDDVARPDETRGSGWG